MQEMIQNKQMTDIQGSLQAHLTNGQYILDLMSIDAKPLLIFFTDCTNSLQELQSRNHRLQQQQSSAKMRRNQADQGTHWQQSGQLDASIHKLHLSDA